jgi:hypothetical protein
LHIPREAVRPRPVPRIERERLSVWVRPRSVRACGCASCRAYEDLIRRFLKWALHEHDYEMLYRRIEQFEVPSEMPGTMRAGPRSSGVCDAEVTV